MFMTRLSIVAAVFAAVISAPDIAGTWTASVETPTGRFEHTFVFKVEGATFTGTVTSGSMPALPISDGKIDGDRISFVVVQKVDDRELKMIYTGTVTGDEMKLALKFPVGTPVDMTAKKK